MWDTATQSAVLELNHAQYMRVKVLTPHTFRIQLSSTADFPETALIRYGILNDEPDTCELYHFSETERAFIFTTPECRLIVDKVHGKVTLSKTNGTILVENSKTPWSNPTQGFSTSFALREDEKILGLGDVTRDRIQKRGYRTMMWVCNVQSYVPIPYIMSSYGWGLLLNTTWRHYFDIGQEIEDEIRIWGHEGALDYFLFAGDGYPALLDRYTNVSGKPHLLPLWGYGLTFVCNQQADAREMLDDCLNFRREGIPCDLVGLEPGWMSEYYDYSVEKQWHPERFYIPSWGTVGPHTFLGAAQRLGFKMSLWLCCDYDLSYEAERRAGAAGYTPLVEKEQHPDDFELDYHQHTPVLMDTLTHPEESWFEHLKKFVDQGVSAFKMDGARQVNEHPDRKWGNGMNDEEMHNLYPILLNQQMHQGFKEHTGRRPMIYSSGGYTGIQKFSATWAGDTGGGPKPLVSMLNHGLSGHANVSCDMDVFTPSGIHFGFLQAWSQVCSWAYWRHPWLLGDTLLPIFKTYARLRYRLLPYIYSMGRIAYESGMPIMRAMTLIYPELAEFDTVNQQYFLGEYLLTAAFTDCVMLPPGYWIDYWTGEILKGPRQLHYIVPEGKGGPLFVKAGALFALWPQMDYVGQKEFDTIELHCYPNPGEIAHSRFVLYEDDGETFAYTEGEYVKTVMHMQSDDTHLHLEILPREGYYDGLPVQRHLQIIVHRSRMPQSILLNHAEVHRGLYDVDIESGSISIPVHDSQNYTTPISLDIVW